MDRRTARRRNRAVKSYLMKLVPELFKRYGRSEQYTVLQIERTIEDLRLNVHFVPYAIALMRYQESENSLDRHQLDQAFLDILRQELADWLFDGDEAYTTSDVRKLSAPRFWRGGRLDQEPEDVQWSD